MLESPSSPLKSHIIAEFPIKTQVKKWLLVLASRTQWHHPNVNKICINILSSCTHQKKQKTSKSKIYFFIANYKTFPIFRGFEQLSSSIGWRVTAWCGIFPRLAFVGLEFLPIIGFWAIILVPDMLTSQSRALKTRMIA